MKNFKRLFSLMLAVCVMATVFAGLTITTSAAAGTPATEVYYCGAKLDATNKYLHTQLVGGNNVTMASANATESGYTLRAEFDASTGTLTYRAGFDDLTQWNTMSHMVQLEDGGVYYGIKANGDLIIDLGNYNNFLYLPNNMPTDNALCGVDVAGNLTINGGTGMLKITAQPSHNTTGGLTSYGVRADGDVTLNGGEIYIFTTANSDGVKANYTTFIDATGHNIVVDGATVRMRSGYSANTPGATRYSGTLVKGTGYTELQDTKVTISDSRGIEGTTETSWWTSNASLSLIPPTGACKITIGKDSVQLGGVNKYLYASTKDTFTVGSTADGAIAEYDWETQTLKFLSNATLEYWNVNNHPVAWIVTSPSDLTIDLNGKTVALSSLPAFGEGGTVNVTGDLTIKGGGTLNAHTRCVYLGYAGGAVLKSGGKIKIENATVNASTSADRAHEAPPRMSYVMYAPSVEFTTDSTVRLSTGATDAANNVAGRVFYGTPTITVPNQADAYVGNLNAGDRNIPAEDDTVKTYSSDLLASSTYFAVSTMDTTVSVDSVAVADGEATFKLSGNVPVLVIAAGYDANGVLANAVTYSGTADGTEQTLSVGDAETVKVYIWNTLDELKPLKKVRIY